MNDAKDTRKNITTEVKECQEVLSDGHLRASNCQQIGAEDEAEAEEQCFALCGKRDRKDRNALEDLARLLRQHRAGVCLAGGTAALLE